MRLSRNVELACGHDEALATLHLDELTAWCPLCVANVQVSRVDARMSSLAHLRFILKCDHEPTRMWRIVWHDGFGGTQTGETSLRPHDFVRGLERRPDWWWIFGSYRALCDCGPR